MDQMKNTSMAEADEAKDVVDSFSSSSSSFSSCTSFSFSSESESDSSEEEVTSPASSSSDHRPLLDMSSLFQQLPIKRGLSKHYQGKSQSFTSLGNVRSVEDLAKPENPYNKKKLKCCRKSYGGGFMGETETQSERARQFCKSSRGSSSSNLGITSRPPMPMRPHHTSAPSATAISNQTPLFA